MEGISDAGMSTITDNSARGTSMMVEYGKGLLSRFAPT
jgi:hypothetical protein